ncbi:MAG: YigZ family protein [Roseiflexus sp.]|nr:YigZ family protein [Roseiflexus sp.]
MTTDPSSHPIPASPVRIELRVVNSRFIGSAAPAATVEAAKAFIVATRTEMPDAASSVLAYVLFPGKTTLAGLRYVGERAGTAGRPVLSVVRGSGLGDIFESHVQHCGQ